MMLMPIIVLGIIMLVFWILKQPAVIGEMGEITVSFFLKKSLDPKVYQVINNVMIPDQDGGTTQIDHIILSPYGLFVIETKTMSGWIFGNKNAEQWTQQLFKNKYKFQNPFRQNYKHIMCLASLTGTAKECFTHIIVFVGSCEIKTKDTLPETLITKGSDLITFIKTFTEVRFPSEQIESIKSAILSGRIANTIQNKHAHVEYVKEIKNIKSEQQAPVCPLCGSTMVQRTVKKGERSGQSFWGCSRYPRCKGIINSETH